MDILVDTTVIIHLLQGKAIAREWLQLQGVVGITVVTWMETMASVASKRHQDDSKNALEQFKIEYLTISDQQWAMEKLEQYQLSHNIGMNDCQIASVAYRLQLPLYTHNLRDMSILVGSLAEKPY